MLLAAAVHSAASMAQTATPMQPVTAQNPLVMPGHSAYGPAFNEGPRQRAYLMKGMANVDFPVTTSSKQAQKFFNQGISQQHGFWFLEAERSFRQAATLDPDCAMAYWGMALASPYNESRAKEFIAKAVERESKVTPRERLWIDAMNEFLNADPKLADRDKVRDRKYADRLLDITKQYPKDIEAKAFYCVFIWENNGQIAGYKQDAVETMLKQVLAANPMHPVHHYRIHLWNYSNDKNALDSAARSGQSMPGCAHMWHMAGHTFSQLHRYADAAWQQEASARVDHAYMIRDHVLPDQIHNYAHNNQWCIEDLRFIGRVRDGIDLAKNMIDLPRHPSFNSLEARNGSASQGRTRLLEMLTHFELWDELIALSKTDYLPLTNNVDLQIPLYRALGVAYFSTGKAEEGVKQIAALEAIAKKDSGKATSVEWALGEVRCCQALAERKNEDAGKQLEKSFDLRKSRQAQLRMRMGDMKRAEELAQEAVKAAPGQVEPLAVYVEVLSKAGKQNEAREQLKALQAISGEVDMQAPIFQRISAISQSLGESSDWRVAAPPSPDSGVRPALDSLGPFRWHPPAAPKWSLTDSDGHRHSLDQYLRQGKPVLLVFYLGAGCAQCMEQLNVFAPATAEFEKAGIKIIAVSTDTVEGLRKTFATGAEKFPFPLVSDAKMGLFRAYRAFDGFENTPLHGVFLIDPKGKVRWQDIGFQPFKDAQFLLQESKRLLAQTESPEVVQRPAPPVRHAANYQGTAPVSIGQ